MGWLLGGLTVRTVRWSYNDNNVCISIFFVISAILQALQIATCCMQRVHMVVFDNGY